jgi:putative holliday junction resolvase
MHSMPAEGVVIGFDFGMRSMGVAVGQAVTRTATPLAALKARDGVPDWALVTTLINNWQPHALVVGIPLNMDGTEQPVTVAARRFARKLGGRYRLPVHEVDERLTTVEARTQLFEQGGYKALDKTAVDSYAAKLMVEQWLGG